MSALTALNRITAATLDARPVALLRVVVGLNAILCGYEVWATLKWVLRPDGLRIPFLLPGTPLPAEWVTPLVAVWWMAALLLAVGLFTRPVGAVLALVMTYVLLLDQQTYSNHLYLLLLEVLFLILADAGACWSVDASLRPSPPGEESGTVRVPAWPITLWKLQISIVYFFAALTKLNPTFLSGEVLATYWPSEGWLGFLKDLRTPQVLGPLSWMAVVTELFLAGALWLPALRRLAVVVGVGLHAGMILMVSQKDPTGLVVFALATLPPYILFFDWSRPR